MNRLAQDTENQYLIINVKDREKLKEQVEKSFSPYLKNEQRTLTKFMDYLVTDYIKYEKIKNKKEYFELFEYFILMYKNSKQLEGDKFKEYMKDLAFLLEEAQENFLTIALNENVNEKESQYDKLYKYMEMLGGLLEKCLYKYFSILYSLLLYKKEGRILDNVDKINFGSIVNRLMQIDKKTFFLKDFIYKIPLNHLRNICIHKDYELKSREIVVVKYKNNKIQKEIKYSDILKILEDINLLNSVFTLLFSLIFLDILPDFSNYQSNNNIRLENSLLSLFFNLRTVDFKIVEYKFNNKDNCFELIFEDNNNKRTAKDAIIHISQIHPTIAQFIFDDKIANISPDNIKISLHYDSKLIATSILSYNKALDFVCKKIDIEELVYSTKLEFIQEKIIVNRY